MREHWPGGVARRIDKIRHSEAREFLATFPGESQHNHVLSTLRAIFQIAIDDRILATSPAADIKARIRKTPIRLTPTVEQFYAIVAEIRSNEFSMSSRESADFVEFLGLAGLGQAEAQSIRWQDIDSCHDSWE